METRKYEEVLQIIYDRRTDDGDYILHERRLFQYVENGSIYWNILRRQALFTTTEIVSMFGCGYKSIKQFILHKFLIDAPLASLSSRLFVNYLFTEGHKGEDKAISIFRERFPELNIVDPFYVDIKLNSYNIASETFFSGIRLGASTDGFIVHPETKQIIGVVEAKTCVRSEIDRVLTEFNYWLEEPTMIKKNRKYRYLVQLLAQCVIMDLSFGILLLYDPKVDKCVSFFVYFEPEIRKEFMHTLLQLIEGLLINKININSAYDPFQLAGQLTFRATNVIFANKFWRLFNAHTHYVPLDKLTNEQHKCWVDHMHCTLHSLYPLRSFDSKYEKPRWGNAHEHELMSAATYILKFIETVYPQRERKKIIDKYFLYETLK